MKLNFDNPSCTTRCVPATLLLLVIAMQAAAQNPSGIYSPVQLNSALPYRVEVRPYSMGQIDVPTLHSYAVGEYDGKFLFISGRTNGLHGFDCCVNPGENFPPRRRNLDVWVIDFANKQSWSRPLADASSGLTESQVLSLSSTNTQFYTKNETLYVTGGYGLFSAPDGGDPVFGTFDTLTAIDLPNLGDWVMGGAGSAAQHIRQINDPTVKVTGGAMYEIDGRTHLVFGQDFDGIYTPFGNGAYTNQVRSFNIVDDGINLSIQNVGATVPDENYRRRDLNVYPVLRPGAGGLEQGLTVLAGVFTPTDEAWSVPVEIDAQGNTSMADPNDPTTFQQAMNVYHSAKLGFFSEARGEMHELLFGGITLDFLNPTNQTIETDPQLPFVNDITAVIVDADGNYSQHHLGFFPELFHQSNRLLRFGANGEFLMSEGIPTFDNGVIKFDELHGEVSLGYIFGGIAANAPHTQNNPGALSAGSNFVFEVVLFVVPEPSSLALFGFGVVGLLATCRLRSRDGRGVLRSCRLDV